MYNKKIVLSLCLFFTGILFAHDSFAQDYEIKISPKAKIEDAEKIYNSLELNLNNENAENEWFKIENSQNKEKLENFIDKYPSSPRVLDAMKILQELDLKEVKSELEESYDPINQLFE